MADDATAHPDVLNPTAQSQLRAIIARVERLEQEKAEIAEQIREVYAEAKGNGYVPKIIRQVIRIRKQDRAKRQEEEAILDLYLSAIGELPLFEGRAAADVPLEDTRGILKNDDDIRATITGPGGLKVETTIGDMKRAAATLKPRRRHAHA